MKTIKFLSILTFTSIVTGVSGQASRLELKFTAIENTTYVQLDSIKVMNRTQSSETMIYWPDTTLSLEISQGDLLLYVGYATFPTGSIPEVSDDLSSFAVHQNYPNPMEDQSEILMYIPHAGRVNVMITDSQGRVILHTERQLDGGRHSFRFHPGGGNLYFLTAYWNGVRRSIQMISTGQHDGKSCRLDYVGIYEEVTGLKASFQFNDFNVRQSGILNTNQENATYTFQFASNIPCPGTPTVEYEGQIYHTIQIFSQCWLKENLNVGEMISETIGQSDNGIQEKYCYNNQPDSCVKYGGLYYWNEMMQYTTQQGARGICPPDWHIPSDEEWKVVEGAVDGEYGIGETNWDMDWNYRGLDAGTNLKSPEGWYGGAGGNNIFGFLSLPAGHMVNNGAFEKVGYYTHYWTSSLYDSDYACYRYLDCFNSGIYRRPSNLEYGISVRCIRDY